MTFVMATLGRFVDSGIVLIANFSSPWMDFKAFVPWFLEFGILITFSKLSQKSP